MSQNVPKFSLPQTENPKTEFCGTKSNPDHGELSKNG